jgi:hypothetical protein
MTNYIHRLLASPTASKNDMAFDCETSTANGWKLSIQGKKPEDAIFLFDALEVFLSGNAIPFKVATAKRFAHSNKEQSKKAMTVYCPDGMSITDLAEAVYSRIMGYTGWHNIKTPNGYECYACGVMMRNDRNENGCYVPAKNI